MISQTSTSTSRVEFVNGNLLVNGSELIKAETAQTISGAKTFSVAPKMNTLENSKGNAVYHFNDTEILFGQVSFPLVLRGKNTRPQYTVDGNTSNDIALLNDLSDIQIHSQAKIVNNIDLNTLYGETNVGWYYAGGGNACSNKPSDVDAFGLEVGRSAVGYYFQVLTCATGTAVNRRFIRTYNSSSWSTWSKFAITSELSNVATSGSYDDLINTPTIPEKITSINGLSGGKLTSPLKISGGDATTAAKISLDQTATGQITDGNTSTLFGFMSSSNLTVGSTIYALQLRGSGTNPTYNGNNVALSKDVSTTVKGIFSLDTTTKTLTITTTSL